MLVSFADNLGFGVALLLWTGSGVACWLIVCGVNLGWVCLCARFVVIWLFALAWSVCAYCGFGVVRRFLGFLFSWFRSLVYFAVLLVVVGGFVVGFLGGFGLFWLQAGCLGCLLFGGFLWVCRVSWLCWVGYSGDIVLGFVVGEWFIDGLVVFGVWWWLLLRWWVSAVLLCVC